MENYIQRSLTNLISQYLFKKKAIIIYGSRQTGKTTLVNTLISKFKNETLILNGDDADIRALLIDANSSKLKPIIGNYKILVIDEAQRIENIGLVLKIIHDNFIGVQLIATGSSSFEIANKINESMTGRKFEFQLYPISFEEMVNKNGYLEERRQLEHRMIFGYYPDIVTSVGLELKLIKSLANSYLYKDLLNIDTIRKPVLLEKILKALALQIGNEVSYFELSQLLNSDKVTIEKYIDLLEKNYIIFRLPGFNKNVRNEIKKGKKIYFYDLGVRNAIIDNFSPIQNRVDKGAIWENFMIAERKKYLNNRDINRNMYFWRTTQQQEIDLLEENGQVIDAYEFKFNSKKSPVVSKTFTRAYPNHT